MRSDLISRPRPCGPSSSPEPASPSRWRGGGGGGPPPGPLLRWPAAGALRVLGRHLARAGARGHAAGALTRRGAAAALVARRARPGPGLRDGGPRLRGRHLRAAGGAARGVPGPHPRRFAAALAGAAGGAPPRGHRQAAPPAARGGGTAGPAAFAESRRAGGATPLRRQQRLLRHGPRARHDLLVRTVCARGRDAEAAQESKHDLVCHKLGLADRTGQRILDVGCGWGSFALHAARHYGARVVGVTLSPAQARWAPRSDRRRRIGGADRDPAAGLPGRAGRDVRRHRLRRHVRARRLLEERASTSPPCAGSSGRRAGCSTTPSRAWAGRASARGRSSAATCSPTASSSTSAGSSWPWRRRVSRCATSNPFASTTPRRCGPGCANLQQHWDAAVAEVGVRRARVWLLYMAASANGFEDGGISIHQVLGVVPGPDGRSGMPPTRSAWV